MGITEYEEYKNCIDYMDFVATNFFKIIKDSIEKIENITDCKCINENEKENEIISVINDKQKLNYSDEKPIFDSNDDKLKFNYLALNIKLKEELQKLLKESVENIRFDLNSNSYFEREDVQKENKEIIIKIRKQFTNYKSDMENYLMKRAIFLKKIGYLARFSHEIAIYIFQCFFIMFKEENGIHSSDKETIRLCFASWIKELINKDCFEKISKNEIIYSQIKDIIEKDINSETEKEFLKNIFPDIIKLYLHCFLTDIKVDIIYADEDSKFNPEYMIDFLLTGLEDKKVLFAFLPGLNCNGQYFDNSLIYVTTYPPDNPNKLPFEKPIFKNIESDINIEVEELNPNLYYNLKDDIKNGSRLVEFVLDPDINWDSPRQYYFYLVNSKGMKYIFDNKNAYIPQGRYIIVKLSLNEKKIEKNFEELNVIISNQKIN